MDYGPAENIHKMVWFAEGGLFEDGIDGSNRLNTKIEPRELVVVDLVKDLSDGVSIQWIQSQTIS